ncbi:MAG: hypothetical protein H8E71_00805 [Candidatus Marinimicrobia bacterium]|nr:hypothetical protein [Candidatus Neomarinimicrobiota bacterium]
MKKHLENIKFRLMKIFILTIIFTHILLSQVSWSVIPMGFDLKIAPNDTMSYSFKIRNTGNASVALKIYIKDIKHNEDGSRKEMEPGILSRGMAGWIDIAPKRTEVASGADNTIRFSVKVPENVQPGDYWSNIYVESLEKPNLLSRSEEGATSFSIFTNIRYAVKLKARVGGDAAKEGEITEVEIVNNTAEAVVTIKSTFKNSGDLILYCSGYVDIRDDMGETVEKINITKHKVYPGGIMIINTKVTKILAAGEYSALAVLDYGGDYLIAGEAFFEIPAEKE